MCASTDSTFCKPFFSSGASLGALPPAGWACSEEGEIKNGEPQCKDEDEAYDACFVHSQSLETEDVLRMKVVQEGVRVLECSTLREQKDGREHCNDVAGHRHDVHQL